MKFLNKDWCSFFAEYIRSVYIGYACAKHDVRYRNSYTSRWSDDKDLFVDVYRDLTSEKRGVWVAFPVALIMWLGVRTFGWIWYRK